jgi:RNA polymerase sigma factor (sigma-70 family)
MTLADLASDDRLARRATSGDQQAFGAIYRRYHQRLYRYCLALVGNPEDAQDALQNTMVKVMRALPGEERRIELKPWLYRIAHNESIDLLRRRRETSEIDPELVARGAGLGEEVEVRERLRRLIADLDQLPDRQRGALVMRELGGLDFAEIAAALGTSAAVARQTLYEARLGLGQMEAGREMTCETVARALSDGDGRVARRRDIRAHLRTCADCRRFGERISLRQADLKALSPLPAVAAAGLLQGLVGGGAGGAAGGGGMATALGGGAAKTLGASAAAKGIATVAVVAAIGVTAADRGGLVDAGLPGGDGGSQATQSSGSGAGESAGQAGSASPAVGESGEAAGAAADQAAGGVGGGKKVKPGGVGEGAQPTSVRGSEGASSHPHGRGHEKQYPSAADHGQQTAAEHKTSPGHGHRGHPAHPAKPPKPAKPSRPPKPAHPAPAPEQTAPASPPATTPSAEPESGTVTESGEETAPAETGGTP